jgi:uncharacterized protein (TIGR00730 family)
VERPECEDKKVESGKDAGETSGAQAQRRAPGARPTGPARTAARPFPSAHQDRLHSLLDPETPQTLSPAYRLSYEDPEFLMRDELRGARLQLEFLKPDLLMRDRGIAATVVVFGSARIPAPEDAAERLEAAERRAAADPADAEALRQLQTMRSLAQKVRYYEQAQRLAQLICAAQEERSPDGTCVLRPDGGSVVVVTGGGPGIMEAANRGAHDIGADNIGLNIVLPFEQAPNRYITPHLCFNFHYFAVRKMHFLLRAIALVVFPGGYGTLDELFEVLTLIQTHKIKPIPVLLFCREYWERIIDFQAMVAEGVIAPADAEIVSYVETAEEAWQILKPVIEAFEVQND